MKHAKAVIIGAGHNGLVAACILAKNGVSVEVVEAAASVGGACSTSRAPCGCIAPVGATAFASFAEEFVAEFPEFLMGIEFAVPDPQMAIPYVGAQPICFYRDAARTIESIKHYSKEDAKGLTIYQRDLNIATNILRPLLTRGDATMQDFQSKLEGVDFKLAQRFFLGSLRATLEHYFGSQQASVMLPSKLDKSHC